MARTSPITTGTKSRYSSVGHRDSMLAVAAIAAVFATGWFLVGAAANVPVIDDWVYAWSVEDLLATGRFHVLPFSAIFPVAQVLWGALFARVAGFSFGALRLSTVVLSVAGCSAVFLTLREMNCGRGTALVGALAVAFHPVYFALSFSFMSEVPFIAFTAWAFYFSTRAIRRNDAGAFWAAALFSLAAFLVRPIAIALPLATLAGLWWTGGWRRGIPPIVTALAVMIALQIALPHVFAPLEGTDARYNFLRYWFDVPLSSYARWTAEIVIIAAFPLMPLWLAQATTLRRAGAAAIAALVLAAVCRPGRRRARDDRRQSREIRLVRPRRAARHRPRIVRHRLSADNRRGCVAEAPPVARRRSVRRRVDRVEYRPHSRALVLQRSLLRRVRAGLRDRRCARDRRQSHRQDRGCRGARRVGGNRDHRHARSARVQQRVGADGA